MRAALSYARSLGAGEDTVGHPGWSAYSERMHRAKTFFAELVPEALQSKFAIAIRMIREGFDDEVITRLTKLPLLKVLWLRTREAELDTDEALQQFLRSRRARRVSRNRWYA